MVGAGDSVSVLKDIIVCLFVCLFVSLLLFTLRVAGWRVGPAGYSD